VNIGIDIAHREGHQKKAVIDEIGMYEIIGDW
jgi:hypothetical protein